jgi:hypothetical protein
MKIFTYYQDVPELTAYDELKLIQLWRERWKALGFEPVVLNEWHARKHPEFEDYAAAFSKLPSVNPKGYDLACYFRWLAMLSSADSWFPIMCDYDVMPYAEFDGKNQFDGETGAKMNEMILFQGPVPSLVRGHQARFLQLCNYFRDVGEGKTKVEFNLVNGAPHTSDMYLLEKFLEAKPEGFEVRNVVKLFGEPGWKKSQFVHYSNSTTQPAGKNPRWTYIPVLRTD